MNPRAVLVVQADGGHDPEYGWIVRILVNGKAAIVMSPEVGSQLALQLVQAAAHVAEARTREGEAPEDDKPTGGVQ